MSNREQKLHRLPDDAMIGGVCAGVAERFDLDVALVRAAFVGMIVFSGFGAAAYFTLWYLLDPPPPAEDDAVVVIDGPAALSADDGSEEAPTTKTEPDAVDQPIGSNVT